MTRLVSGIRLLPIVLFATASLLALKMVAIVGGGGQAVGGPPAAIAEPLLVAAEPRRSWAQDMFNYPDVTGSAAPKAPEPKPTEAKPAASKPDAEARASAKKPEGNALTNDTERPLTAGERAVLERLQERRQELEARAQELDIREGLLKTAERRIESRLAELKELEAQIVAATQKRDEAETARVKGVVTMYENMKAKEAARVFDRLDMRILVDVATQINPRRMSDILAQMSPETAEKLTVELATRGANAAKPASAAELPKIEGRPRS